MCGLTAFSRAEQTSIADGRRFLIAALVAIEDRGYDSTGAAWTQGKGDTVWYDKKVGPATKVAHQLDLPKRAKMHAAIGHTRWLTLGAHTYDNAHPVVADNIVLAHNGVCHNHDELVDISKVKRVGQVDSFAIAAILSVAERMGAKHISEMFSIVDADAALAWFDADDPHSLHLARLSGRPMTLGYTKRGDLVMSSTRATLERTARLTNTRIDGVVDVPMGTYVRVVAGHVVEWVPFGKGAELRRATPPKPTKGRTRHAKLAPAVRSPYHGITDWFEQAALDNGDGTDVWERKWGPMGTGTEMIAARPKNEWQW